VLTPDYLENTLSVLLGDGSGGLGARQGFTIAGLSKPVAVAVADFDGDGKLDAATANYGGNDMAVFLGNGDGTLTASARYASNTAPRQIVAADLDADGLIDIAVTNSSSNSVTLYHGNGDGTFLPAAKRSTGTSKGTRGLALGDFDGNGRPDLVVTNDNANSAAVLLNTTP